jgi:hypothetical protein
VFRFSASLQFKPIDAKSVRQWTNFEGEDVINEIKSWTNTIARRIGIGAALESPEAFTRMVEKEFNSKLLGELGLTLSLSWLEEKAQTEARVLQ